MKALEDKLPGRSTELAEAAWLENAMKYGVNIVGEEKPLKQSFQCLDRALPMTTAYTYLFWLYIDGTVPGWGSIIHRGNENYMRAPGLWLHPGAASMHVRISVTNNWNAGVDTQNLPLNTWNHIAIVAGNRTVTVYLNGKVWTSAALGAELTPTDQRLYCADPWYTPANAKIAGLIYFPRLVDAATVQSLMNKDKAIILKTYDGLTDPERIAAAEKGVVIFNESRKPTANQLLAPPSKFFRYNRYTFSVRVCCYWS